MKLLNMRGVRDALIVAPHPDDETIGAYGLIRRLKQDGSRVRVIVAANGAASHPASARWPRARLVAERKRETRRAMLCLGVSAEDIVFLGLADGRVASAPGSRWAGLRRAIRSIRPSGLLILPALNDEHPDHRAVAHRATKITAPGLRRFAYLVWPASTQQRAPSSHYVCLGAARFLKRSAIRRYRTQTGGIKDDPHGFAISSAELRCFSRPIERYQRLSR